MEKALRVRVMVAIGTLAFLAVGIWSAMLAESSPGVLTVAVLDVGQGDSIYIQSPTGVEVVIDGGPGGAILRELPKVMQPFDRSIDAIIATHPDADHVAGFVELLNRYSVGAYIEPGISKDTLVFARLEREIERRDLPRYLARRGMRLELGGGAELYVLFPDREVSGLASSEANEGGIVLKLVYGEATMLLMADVSQKVERHLLVIDGERLDSDILKVGHHGSRTSTARDFVAAVSPAAAVISVGGNNRYGHPTQTVLDVLYESGSAVLRTDLEGTIVFRSTGGEFVRVK